MKGEIHSVQTGLSPEALKEMFGKIPEDYIKEFLNDPKEYSRLHEELDKKISDSIPKEINCPVCKGGSRNPNDSECKHYIFEIRTFYYFLSVEFINIIKENERVYNDQNYLRKVAHHFFACFKFGNGNGKGSFDPAELIRLCLEEGLLSLSNSFAKSSTFSALSILNETIDDLNEKVFSIDLHGKMDVNYYRMQKRFFEDKRRYYETRMKLEGEKPKESTKERPSRTDIAFYAYYLNESKQVITVADFPSVKAWDELGLKYSKSAKNIQKKYNEIHLDSGKRITKPHMNSIDFVISHMLTEFPEAQKLANDELKLAELK